MIRRRMASASPWGPLGEAGSAWRGGGCGDACVQVIGQAQFDKVECSVDIPAVSCYIHWTRFHSGRLWASDHLVSRTPLASCSRAENGVALEWSPCGHKVLVSTTAPRLRVDNGIQVFRADAARLAARPYPILLQAAWRPAAPGSFSDAPLQTPGGAAGAEPALPPPPAVTGYVPPHLRGNPAAAAAARSKFSLARDAEDRGGKITSGGVVGAPPAAARMQPALPPGGGVRGWELGLGAAGRATGPTRYLKAVADGPCGLRCVSCLPMKVSVLTCPHMWTPALHNSTTNMRRQFEMSVSS